MSDPVGIYLHVPYCRVACPYCDFVKRPVDGDAPDAFTDAVCAEIRAYEGERRAQTIFFGGGTPSLLSADAVTRIFGTLRDVFSFPEAVEISVEVNPDDVTPDRLALWRDLGVNRISLGVQAFDDDVLKFLGRCHNADTARRAADRVAERFDNWGMDLIFGARPGDRWDATLVESLRLRPPHLSTYCLTYEQRTPFWKQRHAAINDDTTLAMYRTAMTRFADYQHYEVSNFATPGFQSAHNRIYWRNEDYVGFGPGAVSFLARVRSRNLSNIAAYLRTPTVREESEILSEENVRIETLIQHFRTKEGIAGEAYKQRFGTTLDEDFGDILENLVARGLLERNDSGYWPTVRGFELNNEIGLALV